MCSFKICFNLVKSNVYSNMHQTFEVQKIFSLSMDLLIEVPIFKAKVIIMKYYLLFLVWISLELSVLMRSAKCMYRIENVYVFSYFFTRRLGILYCSLFHQIFFKSSTVFIEQIFGSYFII